MKTNIWLGSLLLVLGSSTACQEVPTSPAEQPAGLALSRSGLGGDRFALYGLARPSPERRGCRQGGFRAFDFWLGRWDVTDPATGQLFGTNVVTPELGGCAIEEHWTDAGGGRGRSLNTYDQGTRQWQQLWIDHSGGALVLAGRATEEGMMLSGNAPEFIGGPEVGTRLNWNRQRGRQVLQIWELSRDQGASWDTVFQGRYRHPRDFAPAAEVVNPFCGAPSRVRFHWFDFALGEWDVHSGAADGETLGTLTVHKDVSDCLVEFHFQGHRYQGTAFALFQFSTLTWHRTWIDQDGVRLAVSGALVNGAMVMTGTRRHGEATEQIRATWTPIDPNLVEERWETSTDGTQWTEVRRFSLVRRS